MKPKKLEKKLQLNKETMANLNLDEMKKLMGGNQRPTKMAPDGVTCKVCE